MEHATLTALSPLDGRYHSKIAPLQQFFSEYALIRARAQVELAWLKACAQHVRLGGAAFSAATLTQLDQLIVDFSPADAAQVKAIEARTNHDVKALEYWLRERLANNAEVSRAAQFIHFACTSEDINNLAYGLSLQQARAQVMLPAIDALTGKLTEMAHHFAATPMLARTHGQAATPTTLGKELANFAARLRRARAGILSVSIGGKVNGAVGNFNAHCIAFPEFDWESFARDFVTSLGLEPIAYTTQIEPHDYVAELSHAYARLNTVLIDLDRDIWGYISLGYFKQRVTAGEVGSSTMPHKVNPIDFENSEGNLGLANALFEHLAAKLPLSRWQRDLTDSTVLRNLGLAHGYSLLAYDACARGLGKLEADRERMSADLDANWEVLGEAVQTVMRRHGIEGGYEKLKEMTRGQRITRETLHAYIRALPIPESDRDRLLALTPATYLGKATELAQRV